VGWIFMSNVSYKPEPSWRREQSQRIQQQRSGKKRQKSFKRATRILLGFFIFSFAFWLVSLLWQNVSREKPPQKVQEEKTLPAVPLLFSDKELRQALEKLPEAKQVETHIPLSLYGLSLEARTTLDPDLQHRLETYVQQAEAAGRGRPELLSLVVMEPRSGKILGLAGSRSQVQGGDAGVAFTLHPAASLFKIPAAAAAMELHRLTPDSPLFFNGEMYTLYKRQMTQQVHRQTNRISLKEAFAKSVNPVFGKLGYHDLQKSGLSQYAQRFGFGDLPTGTLPVPASSIQLSETPYSWAEVASGFNRRTRITPIHGACIAAVIAADGILPPVHIIEKVMDAEGVIRYQESTAAGRHAIRKETAATMRTLMESTITSGTASRIFRGHQRDRVLSSLRIGGKTGSISNDARDIRYDWFIGYGIHPDGRKIVVSIMVGHGAYIGRRAGEYAKSILSFWFDPRRISLASDSKTPTEKELP
jgi:cell division protein FtsI/penicillin-binding protein 2